MITRVLTAVAVWTISFIGVCVAAEPVAIGVSGPLSGRYQQFGNQVLKGAKLAVEELNESGGVLGTRINLIAADDHCEPPAFGLKSAIIAANELIQQKVVAVIGHFCSVASISTAKIYAQHEVIQISPGSSHHLFTDKGQWSTHRVAGRDDAPADFAASYVASELHDKRVAVVFESHEYGRLLSSTFKAALHSTGVKEAASVQYEAKKKSYAAEVAKISKVAPDLIFLAGYLPDAARIVREMREAGLRSQILGPDSLLSNDYGKVAGDAAEGTLAIFPMDPSTLQVAAPVVQKARSKGVEPDGYTLLAYAAVEVWGHAIEAVGSFDSRKVAKWIRSGNRIKTVLGELTFNNKGDITNKLYTFYRWHGGRFTEARDVWPSAPK